jgi:hypothetical protein
VAEQGSRNPRWGGGTAPCPSARVLLPSRRCPEPPPSHAPRSAAAVPRRVLPLECPAVGPLTGDTDPTKRCRHRLRPPRGRKRGDRCLAWPQKGSALCRTHTPALIEQRRERARELAGQRRVAEARDRKLVALKPVREMLALFLELLDAELERPGSGGPVLATYLRTVQP